MGFWHIYMGIYGGGEAAAAFTPLNPNRLIVTGTSQYRLTCTGTSAERIKTEGASR